MSFLLINGVELEVEDRSLSRSRDPIGSAGRVLSGRMSVDRRGWKRRFDFTTPLMAAEAALAFEALLAGEGHHFDFTDSFYSLKGLGATSSSGASVDATGGKFGPRLVLTGAGSTITWSAPCARVVGENPDSWSVALYRFGTVWDHYIVRSDGAKFLNGARNDALATSWLAVSATGNVTLSDPGSFSNLVCLPFLVPASWAPALSAATVPFSALPRLNVSGDVASMTALGSADSADFQQGASEAFQSLSVQLVES